MKIKQFGKPMILSHPTLNSKSSQEQKWTLLESGIAMKMINRTWLNIPGLSDSVQIINKAELCQCLHTGTVTGACKG